jgi:hypothetical protein
VIKSPNDAEFGVVTGPLEDFGHERTMVDFIISSLIDFEIVCRFLLIVLEKDVHHACRLHLNRTLHYPCL